jgi:hypothetical protein
VTRLKALLKALADRAIRNCSRIERKLTNVAAALNRTIDAYVKGAMMVEDLASRRIEMNAEVTRWEAELAQAEPVPAIELQPQAVEQYRRDIESLHAALTSATVEGDEAVAEPLRRSSPKSSSPRRLRGSRLRSNSRKLATLLGPRSPQAGARLMFW